MPPDLFRALFAPRHVAIVGASDDSGKTTGRPVRFLQKHGFAGRITPVNANRDTVAGLPAVPSIIAARALDAPPIEHAFILTPQAAVTAAVENCIAADIRVATILAGGYADAGAEGQVAQQALVEHARAGGLRLLGPNSIGVVNTANGFCCTANAAFEVDRLLPGRLALVSQSGSMIGAVVSRAQAHGIGFGKLVSVGNEADLGLGDLGLMLAEDADTDAIVLFLETIRDVAALERFAEAAARLGKPVAALKLGRSDIGQEMAVSHTGAMMGSDRLADALLRDLGIVRLERFEALIEAAPLLVQARRHNVDGATPRPVAVVTTTGGGAALVVDQLGLYGIDVAGPSAALFTQLQAACPIPLRHGRVLDLTLAGVRYDVMSTVLRLLADSGEFSMVLTVVGSSAQFHPDLAVKPIIDSAASAAVPIAAFLTPAADESLLRLSAAGIPAFRTPETCAEAIIHALRPPHFRPLPIPAATVATATRPDNEAAALDLLGAGGLPTARRMLLPPGAAVKSAHGLSYPLVVKVVSADLPHKTEAGGVKLNIADADSLALALRDIAASVAKAAPAARLQGFMLQEMISGMAEVIVGFQRTALGDFVTVGAGGIHAEVLRDLAVRRAPVDSATAEAMIDELRIAPILKGSRRQMPADIPALARFIAGFSSLCAALDWIGEAEVNPLILRPAGEGVVAVDCLITAAEHEGSSHV